MALESPQGIRRWTAAAVLRAPAARRERKFCATFCATKEVFLLAVGEQGENGWKTRLPLALRAMKATESNPKKPLLFQF